MSWAFYQKGFNFFLKLGHAKWRSRIEGASIGLLAGFGFPLAIILYGADERKPVPSVKNAAGPQVPGPASGSAAQEKITVPE
jgi:hypothetical protein